MAPSPDAVARIESGCLARHGVFCRSCGESCEPAAILFQPVVGGVPLPDIDMAKCTGCGECLASCPAQSIVLRLRPGEDESA